jgi:LysM repeat protein
MRIWWIICGFFWVFNGLAQGESVDSNFVIKLTVPVFHLMNPDTLQIGEYDEIICDSYSALGAPYVYDALHSFHSRRMDKFGGYLNDKINEGLRQIRLKGNYSDLKQLYIQINPKLLTVHWVAVVGPSTDGKCYVKVNSRGSAGGGRAAVEKQLPSMHRIHEGLQPIKVLEFNEDVIQCFDWRGNALDSFCSVVNIQQHFFKYADPRIGSSITLDEYDLLEQENAVNSDTKAPVPVKRSTKKYRVRAGDTLSGIARKYHTSVAKIKKANNLRSDRIQIGQVLKIP